MFDTVVCTASTFHDTDNEIYTDFPILDEPIFYADEHLVILAKKAAEGMERKTYFGLATTGDRYVEPVHLRFPFLQTRKLKFILIFYTTTDKMSVCIR